MDESDALFISLRPEFAESILDGTKTVELRRLKPRAAPGTLVLLYAASPRKALLGTCAVQSITEAAPQEIWRRLGSSTGIRRSAYNAYFHGTHRAVAITVAEPQRLVEPVPLADLRGMLPGFMPPQSFRYLSRPVVRRLLAATSGASYP